MAKAQFHKNQRVYVKPVGTWAVIERVVPQWVKDVSEPLRVFYDVGLGRDFAAAELQTEAVAELSHLDPEAEEWHVARAANKWRSAEECAHHPYPGTYPIIVTSSHEAGGWRVPGVEYDLSPNRIELQAKVMAGAPKMMLVLSRFLEIARTNPENLSEEMILLARDAEAALAEIKGRTQA